MKIVKTIHLHTKILINNFLSHYFSLFYMKINCTKEYHGTEYGGWNICPNPITKESIIYSFGVGEDVSFDLSIIKKYGVNVYAFDPTPKSIAWVKSQKLPKEFHFFPYGIAHYDGIAKFYPPENSKHVSYTILSRSNTANNNPIEVQVYRLKTILDMVGHKKIDILKMNIEGAEYTVIDDIISSNIEIYQILVQFHHDFEKIKVTKTKKAIESLNKKGFIVFDVSSNGEEYSFIKI